MNLEPEWGSIHKNYRENIRADIKGKHHSLSDISDLSVLPVLKKGRISISHCRSLGGYAFHPKSDLLGLDIEVTARVKAQHYKKLSLSEEEMEMSPGPAYLWTAKEAAFKCLSPHFKIVDFKKIGIQDWHLLDEKTYTCSIRCLGELAQLNSKAMVLEMDDVTLALFTAQTEETKIS